MTERLQEYCDWRGPGVAVDRQQGVIRGVKILGLTSRNGRSYLPEALREAAALYEDAKVNVNHPQGNPASPRDYQDRIGTLRGVACRAEGLFADFHFNPKHPLAEQLLWDAEHSPNSVGFSHNVLARCGRRGGETVVEAITSVQSVDLVADPATTRGLFESTGGKDELAALRAEVTELRLREARQSRQALVRRLLSECGLPSPEAADPRSRQILAPRFLESLAAAADEAAVRSLIEDRAALVRSLSAAAQMPAARDQLAPAAGDVRSFVAAIT